MMYQVNAVILATAMAAVPPAAAQGIPPGASYTSTTVSAPNPQLLVVNPFLVGRLSADNPADSTSSVTIGTNIRGRLSDKVGSDWQVITRAQMNNALTQWGYPADAVLTPTLADQMARQLTVRAMIAGYLTKDQTGQYVLTARVTRPNFNLGGSVTLTRAADQSLVDFGTRVADALTPLLKAYLPTQEKCINVVDSDPKKAGDAAKDILKKTPGFALAEYCLGQIAQKADSNSAEALADFQAAAKGDSLSILPWTQIADIHRRTNDTAAVVADFQHMLSIDPTNQKLAETAKRYFTMYGRPDAVKQLVEEQLKVDPNDPTWLDLESTYCLVDNDYQCALDALSRVYTMDSTRADTAFFAKVTYAASQPPEHPDTAAYLKWATIGARKFPQNADILEALARADAMTGQDDSAAVAANKMMDVDPTRTTALMLVVKALVDAGHYSTALSFAPLVMRVGDDVTKRQYGGILFNGLQTAYNTESNKDSTQTKDWTMVHALADTTLKVIGTSDAQVYTASHFYRGLTAYLTMVPMINTAYTTKSCDMTKTIDSLVQVADSDLTIAKTSTIPAVTGNATNLLGNLEQQKAADQNWIKAFCKPPEQY
jgi:tetratricopeptide (TPR) repeat protein